MCAYLCVSIYLHLFVDACDFKRKKKMGRVLCMLQFKRTKHLSVEQSWNYGLACFKIKEIAFCIIHKQQFSLHEKAYLCVWGMYRNVCVTVIHAAQTPCEFH